MKVTKASSLQAHRRNVYSQNGEDGVIAELLRRLAIDRGAFCDVGAWDGRYGSNCYALLRAGFEGVMIEGDRRRAAALQRQMARFDGRLTALEAFVDRDPRSPRALDRLLAGTKLTRDFALLSIDIDGYDYELWRSLTHYRPVIVVIEVDSSLAPGIEHVYDGKLPSTSFTSMVALGRDKGYTPVCHTGNVIFVRDEDVPGLGLPEAELSDAASLFCRDWLAPTRWDVWRRKWHFMTPQRAWVKAVNFARGT